MPTIATLWYAWTVVLVISVVFDAFHNHELRNGRAINVVVYALPKVGKWTGGILLATSVVLNVITFAKG